MNPLARAAAASFDTLKRAAGVRITYTQSCTSPLKVSLVAVKGRSQMATADGGGGMIEARSADFIVSVADLRGITPSEGDTITEENGSAYQVMTPPYTPSDHTGTRLRIHTKCINVQH